jgi:tetratricopeptide (TPR) repeat protein
MPRFKRLIVELHRRSMWQVLGIYLVGAWIAFEVIQTLTEGLGLPDWFPAFALVLLIVMLPVVLATAYIQEGAGGAARGQEVPPFVAGPGPDARTEQAQPEPGGPARPDEAKAEEARDIHRVLTWRNATITGVLVFALLGVAVTGYMAMRLLGIGPVGSLVAAGVLDPRDRIVLADFEDNTGDSTLALTLTEAFRIDLAQSPLVRIAEPSYVSGVLARMQRDPGAALDYELAREVAIREGLKAVIAGEVNSAGSGFIISARLISAETGEALWAHRETAGEPADVIPAIDRLSRRLRERIGESLKTIRGNEPLAQVTTSSMEALRRYSLAVRAFEAEGDSEKGIALLEEAIAIDTAFAMAYRKLGVELANNWEDRARSVAALTKAYEHRDRLTNRERYLTLGSYYSIVTSEHEKAATAYRTLLDIYPDDDWALNNLAITYSNLGDFERAEQIALSTIELDSSGVYPYYNVLLAQVAQGKLEETQATLERFAQHAPGHPGYQMFYVYLEVARGDYDAAETVAHAFREAFGGSLLLRVTADWDLASLALTRGRLAEAESYYRDLMAVQEQRGLLGDYHFGAANIAQINAWFRGAPQRGLQVIEEALDRHPLESMAPLDRDYVSLANVYATAGRTDVARALLAEQEAEIDAPLRRDQEPWRRGAMGWIALAEDRPDDAVGEFRHFDELAPPIECRACAQPPLGLAYEAAGQADSAIAAYERYVSTPSISRIYWDPRFLALAYERLAVLYEQQGETQKAIHYYSKLADLWQDADHELQPRVEAARRAIQALSRDT